MDVTGPACARCGKPVPTHTGDRGRPRRYCTNACKQAAYRDRVAEHTTRQAAARVLTAWAAATRAAELKDA